MQQFDDITIAALLDELAGSVVDALGSMNERVRELERSSGVTVLDEMPVHPKKGQLAQSRGGLWQFDGESWNVIGNGVHSIGFLETPTGATITIEETNGKRTEGALKFTKPRQRKQPVRLAAA